MTRPTPKGTQAHYDKNNDELRYVHIREITNSMAYGTQRFNATFTKAL